MGFARIAVVVVNHSSHELLGRHLANINLDRTKVDVVVVDTFSCIAEREALRELAVEHAWTLVELDENRGFGAGVNAGVMRARAHGARTVVLLNPDASATGEVVLALAEACTQAPLTAVSPRVEDSSGHVVFQGAEMQMSSGRLRGLRAAGRSVDAEQHGQLTGPVEPWLGGACLALSLELYDRVGGFDERYFLYWEDVDLSHRVLAVGGALSVRRDLVVVHDEGGTQGRQHSLAKSDLYYRQNCRNRLLFASAHLPRRQLLGWIVRTPAQSTHILLRGGRRQLLRSRSPLWATIRGSAEGLRVAVAALVTGPGKPVRTAAPSNLVGRRVLLAHPGAELYGSDRVLAESAAAMVEAGASVTVALPSSGPLATLLQEQGCSVRTCATPVLRKSALTPRGALSLARETAASVRPAWRLLRGVRPDAVYVSTVTIPSWIVLARLARCRVLVHVHEAEPTQVAVVRRSLALPMKLAHRIVVNSRFSRDVLLDASPGLAQRSTVLLNGVPGPPALSPARVVVEDPVRLLYVGRLAPRKGPQVAVAVVAALRARGIESELTLLGSVFAGYEWFEAELRAEVDRAGLAGHVRFLGFDPDVWPHLERADVVLVPSLLDEPFGNTAAEALMAARPVVVSAGGGLGEAVDGCFSALRVEPDRPELWADAVEQLRRDWAEVREQALADALTTAARLAPQRYRAGLVGAMSALTGEDR